MSFCKLHTICKCSTNFKPSIPEVKNKNTEMEPIVL